GHAADAVHVTELSVGDLARPGLVPELLHHFDHGEEAAARGVAAGQESAAGVGGKASADLQRAALDEGTAFATLAEPGVLQLDDHVDGEVVGDARDIDVLA